METPQTGAGRSQWPRRLRHELSSLARTLGSWVQIPLEAWVSVCVYSLFVLSCIVSVHVTCWSPVQGLLLTVYMIHNFRINSEWDHSVESNPSRLKKK
jgi:hypothetical protein